VLDLIFTDTSRRDKLEWNTNYWRDGLIKLGFDIKTGDSPIVPVMLYNAQLAQDVSRDLYDEGVYAIGFFFPVVAKAAARIRTQLSAAHDKEHLDKGLAAFAKVGEKHGILGMGKKEIIEKFGK
jgi:glycine C-acetyltransferase